MWLCSEHQLGRVGTLKWSCFATAVLILFMALSYGTPVLFLPASIAAAFGFGERYSFESCCAVECLLMWVFCVLKSAFISDLTLVYIRSVDTLLGRDENENSMLLCMMHMHNSYRTARWYPHRWQEWDTVASMLSKPDPAPGLSWLTLSLRVRLEP